MNCSYTLGESEVVRAMQIHGRQPKFKAILAIFIIIGVILFLVSMITEVKQLYIVSIAVIIWGIGIRISLFLNHILLLPHHGRKQYREYQALRYDIAMDLSEHGINFKNDAGESKLKWDDIHKWKFDHGIYLLYVTSNLFHIIPSRALSDEYKLIQTLNQYIGPKAQ